MKLDNSVSAIVTGGASGLGAATAKGLADAGVKVAIFDLNKDKGAQYAEELGGVFCKVDVSSDESVDEGLATSRAAIGQERILINCAGIATAQKTVGRHKETGEIQHHSLDMYARVIDINLVGTFRCLAKSAAGMMTLDPIEGERGVIINTASVAAQDGQMGQAAYGASKAGVAGMTLPVARDLAKELIRINTILPGIFLTPMVAAMPDKVQQALAASIPNPARLGDPAEYASLALEMCRNGYLNGETVRLDGAVRMSPR